MESKLFGFKSSNIAGSKIGVSGSGRMVAYRNSARCFSCRGISVNLNDIVMKDPCSSSSSVVNRTSSIHEENVVFQPYQMNGNKGLGVHFGDVKVLEACDDEYNGVIVNPERLPSNLYAFASVLRSSLSHWKKKGKKGIWLEIPIAKSELVPIAVKEGFEYHHAEKAYVMMTYWIPNEPCLLPSNASHQVGVGGFVINDNNEILVVQEKYCPTALAGLWKIPTGFILERPFNSYFQAIFRSFKQSEEIFGGAVREVKEETGIDTEFVEVMAFRHAHNVAFEKSDLFFICMLRPLSSEIVLDHHEIQAAKWMPLIEFVEQPQIQEDVMFKKITEICIARLGKLYCGLSVHKLASKFDGNLSSLYFNIVDDLDSNCQAN